MNNYPLIEKLGLEIFYEEDEHGIVDAGSLEALLAKAPVVVGYIDGNDTHWWNNSEREDKTHTARLICVEEIKPKVCEHKAVLVERGSGNLGSGTFTCCKCSLKLQPTGWEEV
jgi:hypothetical protein